MGKENDVMLEYLEDPARFADVFNGGCFAGARVVRAEQLTEGSEIYVEVQPGDFRDHASGKRKIEKEKTTTRIRDIKKKLSDGGSLRILAIENQNEVDFTMPWRHMNYDCLEYGKQIRSMRKKNKEDKILSTGPERMCGLRQQDRLAPVFTLCIYHGTDVWYGPRCLKDMMEFGENGDCWERLFSDYKMHLLCINEITDFEHFQSPLKELFALLAQRRNKDGLMELAMSNPAYRKLDEETAHVASVLIGVKPEKMKSVKNQGEESYNMCKALEDLISEGREEGREEGVNTLIKLQKMLFEKNRAEDVWKMINDKDYLNMLLQEFDL